MWKSSFLSGVGLIALSGILYTAERFIAVYKWIGEVTPVQIVGSGSYPSEPLMPSIFDNVLVGIILILGIILLILGLSKGFKKSI